MKVRINHGWLNGSPLNLAWMFLLILVWAVEVSAAPQSYSQTFRRSDALRLTIWLPFNINDGKNQNLNLNGNYPIDSRGYVFFPLLGDVKVVGYNTTTLAEILVEKYSPYFQDPVIIVEPLIRVTMLGAFRRPGTYLIPPNATLWQLVDLAGGPDDDSNLKKLWVERGGKIVKKNILSGFEKGYTLQELGIFSGDQVLVPARKKFRVRDAFEILRFGIALLNLYFVIQKF
ncbi:MAG: polysaccharide biosynthesis/export family protein [bacterium]